MSGGIVADILVPVEKVEQTSFGIQDAIKFIMDKKNWFSIFKYAIGILTIATTLITLLFDFSKWLFKDVTLWFWGGPWDDIINMKPKKPSDKAEPASAGLILFCVRYIIVFFYKLISFPKCFLWYFLDTFGWVMYLPFRFVFWLIDWMLGIGIVKQEIKAWNFLDQIDYFVHGIPMSNYFMYQYNPTSDTTDSDGKPLKNGKDPNTLQLGFHIIHFPDSVMYQCYSMAPFTLRKFPPYPKMRVDSFIKKKW